ncbi:MAG: hypothetical protein PHI97_18725 [Desulfobulbus sp.]|nr:hypothetical protein [Desulfobulbus sp.]
MSILTIEDAKNHAYNATNRCLSQEESNKRLEYFRSQFNKATTEDAKNIWCHEINKIEVWLKSDDFKNGNFPQGINELMLELIEWRSMKYAFQNTVTESNPFKKYVFLSQWLVGGTYAVFSLLGKLVSKDNRDNSLRKLWTETCVFIEKDGACTKEEIDYINAKLDKKSGYFTNENSPAFMFRNTAIAHNEKNPTITWDLIDKDINILVRIWSLIVSWSSYGLFDPFRTAEQSFAGFEKFFNQHELTQLKESRKIYLKQVIQWSLAYLHNGKPDPGHGAFSKLSITTSIIPRSYGQNI